MEEREKRALSQLTTVFPRKENALKHFFGFSVRENESISHAAKAKNAFGGDFILSFGSCVKNVLPSFFFSFFFHFGLDENWTKMMLQAREKIAAKK